MPPRWLLLAVIAVYSTTRIESILAADNLNTFPVTSNGWRPIVGTSPIRPYIKHDQPQNPSQNHQKQTVSLPVNNDKHEKNKITTKPTKPVSASHIHINHHGSTGQHVNLKAPISMSSSKLAPRHPVLGKLHAHLNKRQKPSTPTRSTGPPLPRDEIMAPAPSSAIGSYAYFNQGPISIQNTQLAANKHFNSAGHVDFSNHFAFSNVNNDILLPQQQHQQQPQQQQQQFQQFQKHHPSQNDIQPNQNYIYLNQNDDFSRNLVPPPPIYKPQGEKETVGKFEQQTQFVKHEPDIAVNQFNQYQPQNIGQLDLEITKEKFKEFHSTVTPPSDSYRTTTEPFLETTKSRDTFTRPHNYEVTEEKDWLEPSYKPNLLQKYVQNNRYQYQFTQPQEDPPTTQFLPTPYNPDNAFPTSPTQVDVSTIYSEISNKKKLKIPTTTSYNIKEVATHFPLYPPLVDPYTRGPEETTTEQITTRNTIEETYPIRPYPTRRIPSENAPTLFPTRAYPPKKLPVEEVTSPNQVVPTRGLPIQRRPGQRRRRPSKPTTTTEASLNTEIQDVETFDTEKTTVKPQRRRKPSKFRTTSEAPSTTQSTPRVSHRPRPTRPDVQTVTEEEFVHKNHRNNRPNNLDEGPAKFEVTHQGSEIEENVQPVENEEPAVVQEEIVKNFRKTESGHNLDARRRKIRPTIKLEDTSLKYETTQKEEEIENYPEQAQDDNIKNHRYTEPIRSPENKKRKRLRTTTTTEPILIQSTSLNIPENELDYTTISNIELYEPLEEISTEKDVDDYEADYSTSITTAATPSTTISTTPSTSATTEITKTNRLRRPVKYDVQRPRFSVKEYRQRLSQHTSSTTESARSSTEYAPKLRFPNRFKMSTSTTTQSFDDANENSENAKQKFVPKERRKYSHTTENSESGTTEKSTRTIATRLKSYNNRYRSSTEPTTSTSTTTQRVAIKPNIFNNLKRPQPLSLRNRIYNKKRNSTTTARTTTTAEATTVSTEETNTEDFDPTIPFEIAESKIEVTTQVYKTDPPTVTEKTTRKDITTPDEDESFLQLQRIQDLTSSAHKQYNTPGMFKSVSPTSRRVPSYFTIATEDPILPIEAFFSNVNQKN